MSFLFTLLVIALMVGALIDIIRRDDAQVRFLPKLAWIVIVILLPLIGSLLWFAIGREYSESGLRIPRMRRMRAAAPQSPPRDVHPVRPADLRSTEEQIADLDREIEEWRLRAEIEKRRRESGDSPSDPGSPAS
ncbi:PLD nuclease N-terminal domain-containing protein [Microbacterium sp. NPDC089695]|uniref:PLD nuclease N-terminal domain-containing protein n=1 Tax=Microbacterium sp. NPDC089695 TaxID=3364198 RepID=UPI003817301E